MTETTRIGFVCVQSAGRSQMATAFAEQERNKRGLEAEVDIVTGGTAPAESVHNIVIRVMEEVDIDIAERSPQKITPAELEQCDVVATMGCSTLELETTVDVRDWALADPDDATVEEARAIRDAVRSNVQALFDELQR
ncbi:arsenate reductase (glutaredoxin) (plasmid) [Natronomonas pharaonis DSM 2160]|uniref:Arsenate reductase (Glutaredoxin) n=1 Tax=Natronomonas pharaonis (strain ATCC 35678 / DSM 2160 / CIP 103997 / JCM 8858 / NBRC 14720 / NCIMB 2260 / Gabara) TaxID=348780 RepID=Q3IM39_NATPD|nr:low molecular weight phosphatase family protein [Natronomonas pharaonis]CAI50826.1 arsenate reductase (glutaredoxin) [Natronomonas pharaonis DSM 2160]